MKTVRNGARCALAVLALVASGCSGDDGDSGAAPQGSSTTAATGPTSSTGPQPRRVVDVKAEGFTIEIPERWKEVIIDAGALQRLTGDQASGLNEAIANQIRVLAQRNGKLFAYDDSKRTTNLNVLKVASNPGGTIQQFIEGLPAQLAGQNLRDVKVEAITLPGDRPAARASGTATVKGADGKDVDLFQLQYYALSGSFTYVAILATDDPARDQATLEAVGQTFTVF